MSVIGWKSIYETGIVVLDNEHRGLIEHILKVDKEYGAFLESRGGRFIE